MGLYLCAFAKKKEIDGIEIGSYEYFGVFRDMVNLLLENERLGSVCPTLMVHSDCDGKWSVRDCKALVNELLLIRDVFSKCEPQDKIIEMKKSLFEKYNIKPSSLYECFIDVDGMNIVERLIQLCLTAVEARTSILFQ